MKRIIFIVLGVALLVGAAFGQGVNGPGPIWFNDGTTGTTLNLLAISSGVDKTAVNAGSVTVGIIGVCIVGCGTTGISVIADWGDISCSFTGTATDGDFVQAAGSGSQCVDGGATYPTTGGAVLGVVKQGGTGAGVYLVSWGSLSNPSTSGGGLGDPGANGIIKRTALNATAVAVGGTDYLRPSDVSAAPGIGFLYQVDTATPATLSAVAPTGTKCYPYGGTGGRGCDSPGSSSTRTWLFPYQGTTQGGVVGVSVNLPTTNAMVIVPSDSTHINPRWKTTGGNTSLWYWIKLRVPTGHTGAYTAAVTFNAVATTGAANLEIYTACVAPTGAVDPGEASFTDSTVGITLTPAGTTLQNVTASNTFTPTCADGSDLYVKFIPSTNTIGAGDINFSYTSLAITANN